MPQFIIVQCFGCKHYQVTQRRKDSKFKCKLCGSNQSVRAIIARGGNAGQLRPMVQQANLSRGKAEEQFEEQDLTAQFCEKPLPQSGITSGFHSQSKHTEQNPQRSRWECYTGDAEIRNAHNISESEDEQDHDLVTVLPGDMARAGRKGSKAKKCNPINTQESHEPNTQHVPRTDEDAPTPHTSLQSEGHDARLKVNDDDLTEGPQGNSWANSWGGGCHTHAWGS